ncbi:helix-turn-helix domain-containing protein [Chryseobacterium viscerum]|uniref:DNA-binding protein n=1 Tax=Chryseobacterium viscerum TaxID=1037377 RepID=A0A316WUK8_9FLAO|nr:helix-turn-helix domain-containing protein [Chryseobacterium viscerum]PWN64136.1 DNA-binding protein [Chryseobacterium viscerum]
MELLTGESKEVLALQKLIDELKMDIELILEHYRPVMNGEIYLSGEEVCMMLHISKRTLQQYRDDKILPYIQVGGKIIFKQSDLIRILEENYHKNYQIP